MTSTLPFGSMPTVISRDSATEALPTPTRTLTPQPGPASRLVFLTDPFGLAAEQYKIVRRKLIDCQLSGGALLITSPGPGEGKTLTSVNLAWALAEAGHRTCLVDLDFRAPGVFQTLGCSTGEKGVEHVLQGRCELRQALCQVADTRMHLLGVCRRQASSKGLLAPAVLLPVLAELRSMFQWILFDFAPVIPMADVGEVIAHMDGALLVVRSGKTEKKMIPPALEVLGSKLSGVILNDAAIQGSAYYGGYGDDHD